MVSLANLLTVGLVCSVAVTPTEAGLLQLINMIVSGVENAGVGLIGAALQANPYSMFGFKQYKYVDFGEPHGQIRHDFSVRLGPRPVPFYTKTEPNVVWAEDNASPWQWQTSEPQLQQPFEEIFIE
jgi:hypothetical protein